MARKAIPFESVAAKVNFNLVVIYVVLFFAKLVFFFIFNGKFQNLTKKCCPQTGNELSALPILMVGVVLSVGDDDVIHEVDAHQFTSAFDASCQFIVGPAGTEAA